MQGAVVVASVIALLVFDTPELSLVGEVGSGLSVLLIAHLSLSASLEKAIDIKPGRCGRITSSAGPRGCLSVISDMMSGPYRSQKLCKTSVTSSIIVVWYGVAGGDVSSKRTFHIRYHTAMSVPLMRDRNSFCFSAEMDAVGASLPHLGGSLHSLCLMWWSRCGILENSC